MFSQRAFRVMGRRQKSRCFSDCANAPQSGQSRILGHFLTAIILKDCQAAMTRLAAGLSLDAADSLIRQTDPWPHLSAFRAIALLLREAKGDPNPSPGPPPLKSSPRIGAGTTDCQRLHGAAECTKPCSPFIKPYGHEPTPLKVSGAGVCLTLSLLYPF